VSPQQEKNQYGEEGEESPEYFSYKVVNRDARRLQQFGGGGVGWENKQVEKRNCSLTPVSSRTEYRYFWKLELPVLLETSIKREVAGLPKNGVERRRGPTRRNVRGGAAASNPRKLS